MGKKFAGQPGYERRPTLRRNPVTGKEEIVRPWSKVGDDVLREGSAAQGKEGRKAEKARRDSQKVASFRDRQRWETTQGLQQFAADQTEEKFEGAVDLENHVFDVSQPLKEGQRLASGMTGPVVLEAVTAAVDYASFAGAVVDSILPASTRKRVSAAIRTNRTGREATPSEVIFDKKGKIFSNGRAVSRGFAIGGFAAVAAGGIVTLPVLIAAGVAGGIVYPFVKKGMSWATKEAFKPVAGRAQKRFQEFKKWAQRNPEHLAARTYSQVRRGGLAARRGLHAALSKTVYPAAESAVSRLERSAENRTWLMYPVGLKEGELRKLSHQKSRERRAAKKEARAARQQT